MPFFAFKWISSCCSLIILVTTWPKSIVRKILPIFFWYVLLSNVDFLFLDMFFFTYSSATSSIVRHINIMKMCCYFMLDFIIITCTHTHTCMFIVYIYICVYGDMSAIYPVAVNSKQTWKKQQREEIQLSYHAYKHFVCRPFHLIGRGVRNSSSAIYVKCKVGQFRNIS